MDIQTGEYMVCIYLVCNRARQIGSGGRVEVLGCLEVTYVANKNIWLHNMLKFHIYRKNFDLFQKEGASVSVTVDHEHSCEGIMHQKSCQVNWSKWWRRMKIIMCKVYEI